MNEQQKKHIRVVENFINLMADIHPVVVDAVRESFQAIVHELDVRSPGPLEPSTKDAILKNYVDNQNHLVQRLSDQRVPRLPCPDCMDTYPVKCGGGICDRWNGRLPK